MYATVNGTRIFFDVDGSGLVWKDGTLGVERPVMVLLPGGPAASHMHYKNPMLDFGRLRSAFQLLYVDWRGAGHSAPAPPETMTLEQAVADVEAIRELLGIERWVVLGASAGGMWGLEYAAAHPERVDLLVAMHCPATTVGFGDVAETNARRAGITDPDALRIYRAFVDGTLEGPVAEWAKSLRNTIIRTQQTTYIDPDKHPDAIEEHQRRWDTFPEEDLLAEFDASRWYLRDMARNYRILDRCDRITAPALVITGETDPVAPADQAEAIAGALPDSELYIHSGGHMPRGDEMGPFWARIDDWFARHGIEVAEPVRA
jgi:proline iminopeptidase